MEVPTADKLFGISYDKKFGRKQIALKILAVNIASHLRWNLNNIEKNWSPDKQIQLLEDLCTIASGMVVEIPITKAPPLNQIGNKCAYEFALFVYHRWILRVYKVFKDIIQKKKAFEQQTGVPPEMNPTSARDELFFKIMDPEPQDSIDYLVRLCNRPNRMPILTATSIVPLTTNSEALGKGFRLDKSISPVEFRAQIYFDLCQYYLYNNSHELAKKYVILCRENFQQLQVEYKQKGLGKDYLICDIDEGELNGVLLACGASAVPDSLAQRFNTFVMNGGDDLLDILRADNVAKEIPFVQRKIIELDMEAASLIQLEKNKDVIKSIVALNSIRSVVGPETVMSGSDFLDHYKTDEDFAFFAIFVQQYLKDNVNEVDKQLLGNYLLNAVAGKSVISGGLLSTLKKLKLISEEELMDLHRTKSELKEPLPEIARKTEWEVPETNSE